MAKLFESEFQKGVMVAVVKPADPQYTALKSLFVKYGYGFAMPDQKLIFIDGSYVDSIQTIVEAHEVGHIVYLVDSDNFRIFKSNKKIKSEVK